MSAVGVMALEQLIAWAERDLTRDADARLVLEELLDSLPDLARFEEGTKRPRR